MENRRKDIASNKWFCYSFDNSNQCMLKACKGGYCVKCEPKCKNKLPTVTENTKYKTYNSGEEFVRELIFKLTGVFLVKTREIIKPLELDGYSEDLKLAFEFQGEQHYKQHVRWHKDEDEFKQQQLHDAIKVQKCAELGINLIVIDGRKFHTYEQIVGLFVYDKLIEFGYNLTITRDKLTKEFALKIKSKVHEHWKDADQNLQKLADKLREKGFALLSEHYLGHRATYEIVCENDHIIKYSYHNIMYKDPLCCYICVTEHLPPPKPKIIRRVERKEIPLHKSCNEIVDGIRCPLWSVLQGKCTKHNPNKLCQFEEYECTKLKVNKTNYCQRHRNNEQHGVEKNYSVQAYAVLAARRAKDDD